MTPEQERDEQAARLATGMAAYALGLDASALWGPERRNQPQLARARHLAVYLGYVGFAMTMGRAARAFGCDRSSIGFACRRVEEWRDDPRVDSWVEGLETALREAPPPASWPVRRKAA
jgi:hypothetical protein